jgi:carboxylesterase type B
MCAQGPPAWAAVLTTLYAGGDGDAPSAAPLPPSEDCLILDVFAPPSITDEGLPVLLWIHGGRYTQGYAANAGGPNFVSSSNGSMVFVSIQCRLGVYGFLSSEAVADDRVA